jgi:hypothetical protein
MIYKWWNRPYLTETFPGFLQRKKFWLLSRKPANETGQEFILVTFVNSLLRRLNSNVDASMMQLLTDTVK